MPTIVPGAFRQHALDVWKIGLAPTPTAGEDGKRPILKGYPTKRLGPPGIKKIAANHPTANLAVVTGLSDLNVVDIDDPALLESITERFGATPLVVKTPGRGGYQLYYKANVAVRPVDLRVRDGLAVEIKAHGNIVLAPPSRNFKTGRDYEFVRGDWGDLKRLPELNMQALERTRAGEGRGYIGVGRRNAWLFSQCLKHAPHCDDVVALIDIAFTRASENFAVMLRESEIEKTARSAWRYEIEDRNWVGRGHQYKMILHEKEMQLLDVAGPNGALALRLLFEIQRAFHVQIERGEPFPVSPHRMKGAATISGWSRRNYEVARDALLLCGALKKVRQGRGEGHPSLYVAQPLASVGRRHTH